MIIWSAFSFVYPAILCNKSRRGVLHVTRALINVDYTVDYTMGTVTILNQAILASGNNIDVQLESQSMFNMQRKTLVGAHAEYAFTKDFSIGGTIMHLSEMPLVVKTEMGAEPIANTLWGLNAAYRGDVAWLTKEWMPFQVSMQQRHRM